MSLEGDEAEGEDSERDADVSPPAPQSDPSGQATLPLAVDDHWIPSGYQGDGEIPDNVKPVPCPTRAPSASGECHGFEYSSGEIGWAGVLWQHPANNWGELPGKRVEPGATYLNAVAWVASGTQRVTFQTGSDLDAFAETLTLTLTTTPTRLWLDLRDVSYEEVTIAFGWTMDRDPGASTTLYVDDVRLENAPWGITTESCESLPCLNGGTCEGSGADISCDCSATNFEGELCETPPGVTFSVDLSCADLDEGETVYVHGDFNGWCTDCLPLTQVGDTGLWSRHVSFPPGQEIEYKYVAGSSGAEDLVDDMWAGGTCAPVTDYQSYANRQMVTPSQGSLETADLFGRCLPCDEPLCVPHCAEEAPCGPNGCGLSCGTCEEGLLCTLGQCQAPCVPTCGDDKVCGDDGCGGSCGECGEEQFCNEGVCGDICIAQCAAESPCGDDGCGGSCGECDEGLECVAGVCGAPCQPSCASESQCGDDGCGGSCGTCDEGLLCLGDQCVAPCEPSCASENACGDDGCGNSCGSCGEEELCESGQCVPAPPSVDITFSVDMTCSGLESFTTVFVVGPWENWSSGDHPLSDPDGDGVWTGTYSFEPDSVIEYKYQVDGWAAEEDLIDDMLTGFTCAPVTNYAAYANRKVTADVDKSVNDTFGSCKACDAPMPPGVTFEVDMGCSGLSTFGFVAVTGPFSGWCPNCNQLKDPDGDGVYSGTFLFDPGTTLEYKYHTDGFADAEDLIDDMLDGGTCAPVTDYNEYANRQVEVVDGPPVVVQDVYGTCEPCP